MANFGLIGLGTMGQNLALNLEEHGLEVAVWNLEGAVTEKFVAEHAGKRFTACGSIEELVRAIAPPRRILLMITAGKPVDATLTALTSLVDPGDVVIDGGNSDFHDTERRQREVAGRGFHFVGMGVSGGAEGARLGPSMMPGGPREAWEILRPALEPVAAKTEAGPCVTWVGPGGSGHFVKTVHNGIEYGMMQLLAEAYDLFSRGLGWESSAIGEQFARWNAGPLGSFLMEVSARVLAVRDEKTGRALVDVVEDAAAQKGTGRWTVEAALALGVPVPTLAAALDARALSSRRPERLTASKLLPGPGGKWSGDEAEMVADLERSLDAGMLVCWAQGLTLIEEQSAASGWGVALDETARIWKGGCIIRARVLDELRAVLAAGAKNILLGDSLRARLADAQDGWRRVVSMAASLGIGVPALASALSYYDMLRAARLPQSLTQAQRDAFGAHGYRRVDQDGTFHTDWLAKSQ